MRSSRRAWLYAGLVWLSVTVIPFAVVGESWGMVWYYLALPSSFMLKPIWDAVGPVPYVAVASLVNAGLVAAAGILLTESLTPPPADEGPGRTPNPNPNQNPTPNPTGPQAGGRDHEPNPRAALNDYIREVRASLMPQYQRSSERLHVAGMAAWGLTWLTALVATTLGAVVTPVIAVVGGALLSWRISGLRSRREGTRIALDFVIATAQREAARVTASTDIDQIHERLIQQVRSLERASLSVFI